MPERLSNPNDFLIVEIGVGREGETAFSQPLIATRTLQPYEQYVGIDRGNLPSVQRIDGLSADEANIRMRSSWRQVQEAHVTERVSFVQADGRDLPFANSEVDQVVARNLFGFGATDEVLIEVYKDAMRVLKPGGELAMYDDITPRALGSLAFEAWLRKYKVGAGGMTTAYNAGRHSGRFIEAMERYGLDLRAIAADGSVTLENATLITVKKRDPNEAIDLNSPLNGPPGGWPDWSRP